MNQKIDEWCWNIFSYKVTIFISLTINKCILYNINFGLEGILSASSSFNRMNVHIGLNDDRLEG